MVCSRGSPPGPSLKSSPSRPPEEEPSDLLHEPGEIEARRAGLQLRRGGSALFGRGLVECPRNVKDVPQTIVVCPIQGLVNRIEFMDRHNLAVRDDLVLVAQIDDLLRAPHPA